MSILDELLAAEEEVRLLREENNRLETRILFHQTEEKKYKRLYYELENAISWNTDCLNCASLLDQNYIYYATLEKIRDLTLDDVDAEVWIENNSILEIFHELEAHRNV